MERSGFQFKQFKIYHDQCAMKVGTDGVLLGAWADISHTYSILDLGCGTGLIALMLAQRTSENCQITAVEIENNAYRQAVENVAMSPWQERVNVIHGDVVEFCQQTTQRFDLIVANPPYFATANKCRDDSREMARYLGNSSHLAWLKAARACLSERGKIQFVLPFAAGMTLLQQLQAEDIGLTCEHLCKVVTKVGKSPQRILLSFVRSELRSETKSSQLTIYTEQHQYHSDVIPIFQPFYLKL
ncbi:tRNA1(Val) (adenine(37)-N6)-methyltransferase [Gallibacterium melopsittaci]|uniref:tRNA1(Val) (adenine(37)-N6)-methyltransferase n=1 Tax=Gallibacterium melopsittaci TaxID=516063 RepID=A0ABV6HVC2_9PAST